MLAPGSRIHVLGACGTAMATFAAMLKDRGHQVRGSDQDVYPPMSELLAEKGIELRAPYGEANLDDPEPDLVVVGNAIPRGNAEMEAVLDRGIRYRSFPELLREEFLEGRHPVVWDGTDLRGGEVSSGIYFYRVQAFGESRTRKMALIR